MSDLRVNSLEALAGGSIISRSVIKCNTPPSASNDLTNKNYVDTALSAVSSGAANPSYVDIRDKFYYDQVTANFVKKTETISETISGVKTFQQSPLCFETPSTNTALTNKSYVDGSVSAGVLESKSYVDSQIQSFNLSTTDVIRKIVLPNQSVVYTDSTTQLTYTGPAAVFGDNPIAMVGKNGVSVTGGTAIVSYTKPGNNLVQEEVNVITIDNKTSWIAFDKNGTLRNRSSSNISVFKENVGNYMITHNAVGGTSVCVSTSFSGRIAGNIQPQPFIVARATGITGVRVTTKSGTVDTDFDDLISLQIMG